jgi:succinate dehydrogenase/fumarate reductase cytochrome b subunit
MSEFLYWGFIIAGLVLAFNGVVQLCVRKKTGPWKEGGASLLAGAIIVVVMIFFVGSFLWDL